MKPLDTKARVGIGVIIENVDGNILIGKRNSKHAPYFSIPGGKLDTGETFEETAIREIKEETGLTIKHPKVIAVTNNLKTFQEEGLHYVSIILYTNDFSGTPTILEPDKCSEWLWCNPNDSPKPHFEASEYAIKCYLSKKFYIKNY